MFVRENVHCRTLSACSDCCVLSQHLSGLYSALPFSHLLAHQAFRLVSFHWLCDMNMLIFRSEFVQVITVLRKLLGAEMKAKASNNAELRPQSSSTPSD